MAPSCYLGGTCYRPANWGPSTDVRASSQLETGKNLRWEITVQPSGNEEVIVTLPPTIDCAAQGAICTGDGRMLSVALAILVPGPQNAPTITGTARVGETLTASTTGITDSDGLTNATFTYQWIKLDSNLNDSDISGATSSTYTLVAGDADTGIKVRVSFTDDRGNTESLTTESALIVTAANNPATGAPTISGTARVGETLTASTTGIADSDGLAFATFTYQWIKLDSNLNDSDISGATSSTYTLVAGDADTGIKVRVSFTDDRGNTESLTTESALIVTAANSPATGAPTITGTARVGETLTASTTGIADSDGLAFATFTYQWIKLDSNLNDSDISGATSSTYTLVAGDADTGIKVRVSFTDDRGNTESLTTESALIVTAANSPATGAPTITGTARVGETLTASTTGIADSDGLTNATFTYQWLADDAAISGATGSTYMLVAADVGKGIKVRVSFTDDRGNTESLTTESALIVTAANSPATGAPTITGTARVGETLTASTTGITDSDGLAFATFTYQWIKLDSNLNDSDISGATGSTYTLVAADAGKAIKVRVSFTDDAGNTESLTSGASAAVTAAKKTASGTARVGETLTANNPATGAAHHQRHGPGGRDADGERHGHSRHRRPDQRHLHLQDKRRRLSVAFANGGFTYPQYYARLAEIDASLRLTESVGLPTLEEAAQLFEDIPQLWREATPEERRKLISPLIERVYVDMDCSMIGAIVPASAFRRLLEGAMARAESPAATLLSEDESERLKVWSWWRRGRGELSIHRILWVLLGPENQ